MIVWVEPNDSTKWPAAFDRYLIANVEMSFRECDPKTNVLIDFIETFLLCVLLRLLLLHMCKTVWIIANEIQVLYVRSKTENFFRRTQFSMDDKLQEKMWNWTQ